MKRSAPLRRRKPLRRVVIVEKGKARVKRQVDPRRLLWNQAIRGTSCVNCQRRPAVEGHHIIREQVLRRFAREHGYDFEEVRFDRRNRLGLCRQCHSEHHSGKRKLSKQLLWRVARWVFDFARELDLEWVIDREYVQDAR